MNTKSNVTNLVTDSAIKIFFETHKLTIAATITIMIFAIGITVGYIAEMKNEELNDIQSRKNVDMEMMKGGIKGW